MNLLFNSHPLVVDKDLANILGLNEALVLQQIHYWLEINRQAEKNLFKGCCWTYNTVAQWQEQFPFFSASTVKRTLKILRDKGLLLTDNFNRRGMDRTLWYTIDYDRLEQLEQEYMQEQEKRAKAAANTEKKPQNGVGTQKVKLTQCKGSDWSNPLGQNDPMQKVNLTPPIPETNTETTTEIPSIYPAPEKAEQIDPMDEMEYAQTEALVRENISADYLKEQYGSEEIEEIVLLLTDTLCSSASKIKIGREWMNKKVVCSRLLKLDETHIACVLDTMQERPIRIRNMRSYLLTALYNAPSSSCQQTAAKVNYDLWKGGDAKKI